MTRTQQTQTRSALSPTLMDTLINPNSPGPSTIFGTTRAKERGDHMHSFTLGGFSPISPSSPRQEFPSTPPPPPPAGRAYTHTRSASESLAHPNFSSGPNGGLTKLPRPRDEIRDLTEQERLRVEWDILLRKKDKYKTWKKRTKDEWRELENAKVLMEANRQRMREDEMIIGSEKRVIEEERARLSDEKRGFEAFKKDVEMQKMELEEQRIRLADDRQILIEDLEKYHREREEYEDERRKHAEETVLMRREWEGMKEKYDEEVKRLDKARHEFDADMRMYEKERRIYEAIRQVLEQPVDEIQNTPHFPQSRI